MSNETEANFSDIFAYFSAYNSIKVSGIMSKINKDLYFITISNHSTREYQYPTQDIDRGLWEDQGGKAHLKLLRFQHLKELLVHVFLPIFASFLTCMTAILCVKETTTLTQPKITKKIKYRYTKMS
jgi:hypothetical protein